MALSTEQLLQLAIAHHQAGRLPEAERLYRIILQTQPRHSDANHNLGVLAIQVKQPVASLPYFKGALEANPNQGQYWLSYLDALIQAGETEAARQVLQQARQRGVKNDTGALEARLGPARQDFNAFSYLFAEGRYKEALPLAQTMTVDFPQHGIGWKALGVVYKQLGRSAEALDSMLKAVSLLPNDAEAHSNLATVLRELGQLDSAEKSCRRALEIRPEFSEAHNNLGTTLRDLGRLDDAVMSYRRALEINPHMAEAHSNLGAVLQDLGQPDHAVMAYHRALEIKPLNLQYAIHAYLLLPAFAETLGAMVAWRERYQNGISALADATGTLEEPGRNVNPLSFYLAYHNCNDRKVMEALCGLFRARLPELTIASPHVSSRRQLVARGQRIRIGFLSEFLVEHTIGKLYLGFISHLDRSRFEVVVIHTPKSKRDNFRQHLDVRADKVLTLPSYLKGQQQAVLAEKLDVLFYPDIGMAPPTYFLAHARLAPVQVVGWGHPDTTGLDTMDYFVSAVSIEPEDAEEHYTERLIRLNRLPCYYQPWVVPARIPSRTTMGLPETGTLYGCPQSLFKFHPDFDAVLASVAEGDPAGHIVLLDGKHSIWAKQLKARWAKAAPILLERVRFLPHMPLDHFMALIAHVDVLLDPIHFGSGNTLYEAMVYGTPVVTWPGQFMRGRIVAGAYQQMGITDAPIARRLEDYAPLALDFGRDQERRRALRQASLESAGRELFEDMRAVREFEIFLEASVVAAQRGEKLPAKWKPDDQFRRMPCVKS